MTDFAKNLRILRKQSRMSQFMLADKLGVSQRTVSHYENGSSEPSLQILCRIARIFSTYGSGGRIDDQRVVIRMVVEALLGRDILICGSGEQLRTFCWAGDMADALIRLMNIPSTEPTATVNLGSSAEVSINRLAEKIVSLTGSRSRIVHIAARADDPRRMAPDLTRARNMLGWTASTTLSEGLRATIEYAEGALCSLTHKNAPSWIESL